MLKTGDICRKLDLLKGEVGVGEGRSKGKREESTNREATDKKKKKNQKLMMDDDSLTQLKLRHLLRISTCKGCFLHCRLLHMV